MSAQVQAQTGPIDGIRSGRHEFGQCAFTQPDAVSAPPLGTKASHTLLPHEAASAVAHGFISNAATRPSCIRHDVLRLGSSLGHRTRHSGMFYAARQPLWPRRHTQTAMQLQLRMHSTVTPHELLTQTLAPRLRPTVPRNPDPGMHTAQPSLHAASLSLSQRWQSVHLTSRTSQAQGTTHTTCAAPGASQQRQTATAPGQHAGRHACNMPPCRFHLLQFGLQYTQHTEHGTCMQNEAISHSVLRLIGAFIELRFMPRCAGRTQPRASLSRPRCDTPHFCNAPLAIRLPLCRSAVNPHCNALQCPIVTPLS